MKRAANPAALSCVLLLVVLLKKNVAADWLQLGGSSTRNNVAQVTGLPLTWQPGKFDRKTGHWNSTTAENIRWVAPLGSQTYGSPVVADGRILIGTNNNAGNLPRYPADIDLGCLVCF